MNVIRSIPLFLALFTVLPVKPITKDTAAKMTLAGCAFGLGWIGYNYWSTRPSAEQLADQSDRELKKQVERGGGKDIASNVARLKLREFELLAYEDREKLLTAVIYIVRDPAVNENLFSFIRQAHTECQSKYDAYKKSIAENHIPQPLTAEEPFALTACIISRHTNPQLRIVNCLPLQNPNNLYIKNVTNPAQFIGRPLMTGECAIIGYSDGDVQIHLHNADRRQIKELTYEQRDLIKRLFTESQGQPHAPYLIYQKLSRLESRIFNSLNSEVQEVLHKNYAVATVSHRIKRQGQAIMHIGLALLDIARYSQLLYEENYSKFIARFLLGFSLYGFASLNQQDINSFGFQLRTFMVMETCMNGHFIMNKLGSLLTSKAT